MKRYSAAAARQRFSHLLDAAEQGEGVVIERRGVQFELRQLQTRKAAGRRKSLVASVDPAVESGQWTWQLGARGLQFTARKARR
jgi:antitoxin (DNA-binding transcriptional repressor) of toxin-antitoxin stability system